MLTAQKSHSILPNDLSPRRAIHSGTRPTKNTWRITAWAVVAVLTIGIGVAVAVSYSKSLKKDNQLPVDNVSQKIWWRARLYARKATGGAPELSWSDLWNMTRQQGGFGLESTGMGVSVAGSVVNPYRTHDDRETGSHIFLQRCAMCHGINGVGRNGPALNHPGLKHGDSDLAIYSVLRDGVPGTPMVSADISPSERWQVVGFVKTLMIHGSDHDQKTDLKVNVASEEIRSAGSRTDEWLTYSGSLDGHRYTPLSEINSGNVSRLRIRWIQQFDNTDPTTEATPLVVDGTIFITEPPSNVVALDAKSGDVIWTYDRKIPGDVPVCCGRINRGVAIFGQSLFLNTLDGYLVAMNANTGRMIWETRVADNSDGYSMTGAPLIANQSVIVGVAGGDFGIRGFVAAYDPVTGKQQWKFNTIPAPGEPGHETWKDGWRTGGGATWATGSYDPNLDLLYWGVGNPAPSFSGDHRQGDDLYTSGVIALHVSTGKLAWFFQFTPHDEHDWDATQTPVLTDVSIGGRQRHVICWANRNGFYYVLDRATGEFLTGVPFVEQNWAKGLDSKGRPILSAWGMSSDSGKFTMPSSVGGTNWQNTALDQRRGLIFVHATEGGAVYTKSSSESERVPHERPFLSSFASSPDGSTSWVRALDVASGAKKWEYRSSSLKKYSYSGLLATGAGLVFGASDGYAFALDSVTGVEKWRIFLGGETRAAPISFTVEGRQVVAYSAGRSLFLFGL